MDIVSKKAEVCERVKKSGLDLLGINPVCFCSLMDKDK